MAEGGCSLESFRRWVVEHKLRRRWPNMKPSVKIIHARLHTEALTLAALAGAAVAEYNDHQTKYDSKVENYTN